MSLPKLPRNIHSAYFQLLFANSPRQLDCALLVPLDFDNTHQVMETVFVRIIDGLSVPLGLLHKFTSQNDFPKFFASSFPVFALDYRVSELDLRQVADLANEQARAELGFAEEELIEIGYAAAIPQPWQLCEKLPPDAMPWYHEQFNKFASSTSRDPKWYPLGFLGIASLDWKKKVVVLVFYDALHNQTCDSDVPVRAFIVDPSQIGPTLISLRQGDDDYENTKKHSVIRSSRISCT